MTALRASPITATASFSKKSVLTGTSKMTLSVPRDRAGTFDPKLIAKYQRRFPDFDNKIISMYARGMTVREIRGHLEELYGIDVSPDLISAVTDAVLDEVAEWQNRPSISATRWCSSMPFGSRSAMKASCAQGDLHRAGCSLLDGTKEILVSDRTDRGRQILATCVVNELKSRVQDILIAVVNGLKGFPEAINAVFHRHRSKPASST